MNERASKLASKRLFCIIISLYAIPESRRQVCPYASTIAWFWFNKFVQLLFLSRYQSHVDTHIQFGVILSAGSALTRAIDRASCFWCCCFCRFMQMQAAKLRIRLLPDINLLCPNKVCAATATCTGSGLCFNLACIYYHSFTIGASSCAL